MFFCIFYQFSPTNFFYEMRLDALFARLVLGETIYCCHSLKVMDDVGRIRNKFLNRLDSTCKVIVTIGNGIVGMRKVVDDPHPFVQTIHLVPMVNKVLHIGKELHSFRSGQFILYSFKEDFVLIIIRFVVC